MRIIKLESKDDQLQEANTVSRVDQFNEWFGAGYLSKLISSPFCMFDVSKKAVLRAKHYRKSHGLSVDDAEMISKVWLDKNS